MARIIVDLIGASEADMVRVESSLLLTVPPMMPDHVEVTIESSK